jgi:cholesterol transport system auxiliary component
MRGRAVSAATLALGLAAALPGCLNLAKGYPEKKFYVLRAARKGGPPSRTAGELPVLKVPRFRVSPLYDGKEFVYRKDDLTYESDFYNVFFISPASLLTEEARRWLSASGRFQHVIDPSSRLEGALVLEGMVTSLYGDFREKESPRAVLEIQIALIENPEAGSRVVFKKDYRQETALAQRSAAGLARGWNEGLGRILTALEEDLGSLPLSGSAGNVPPQAAAAK